MVLNAGLCGTPYGINTEQVGKVGNMKVPTVYSYIFPPMIKVAMNKVKIG
jgi:hypothetical protein